MTIGLIAKLGPRLAVVGVVLIVHRPRPEMPGRPQLLTSWLRLLIGTSPRLKQLILDPNTGLFFAGWSFWWNSTLQSFADPIMWSYVKRLVSSKKIISSLQHPHAPSRPAEVEDKSWEVQTLELCLTVFRWRAVQSPIWIYPAKNCLDSDKN